MKLYFNFWPDPNIFLIKIYLIYIFSFILVVLIITLAILIFFEIKKIYYKNKAQKLLEQKINNLKASLLKEIENKEDDSIIKTLLEYIQIFLLKWKYQTIDEILNKLNLDYQTKKNILDYIFKDKPLSKQDIEKIKIWLHNFEKEWNI